MRTILTALFLCFAILVGIVESASGASTVHGSKTASGDFWQNPNICTYKLGSLGLEPCRGDTIVGYDSATDVLYYVRQNPWSKFDPHGLHDEVVGDVYDLKSDETHYQGMTEERSNTSGGGQEDAQNRLNRGGTKGHQKAHDVLQGTNPQGHAYQVTVPKGTNLNKKQSLSVMEAVESKFMHEKAAARKGIEQINDKSARYTLKEAQEIIDKYSVKIGDAREYIKVASENSIGMKWAPKVPLGALTRMGRRVPYVKYAFATTGAMSIKAKLEAGEYGNAVYEAAGFAPLVGEAQLAYEGGKAYMKGAQWFFEEGIGAKSHTRGMSRREHRSFWGKVFGDVEALEY